MKRSRSITFSPKILPVLGAIGGDIIGSIYEHDPVLTKDFPIGDDGRFTDDTLMTIAIAEALTTDKDYTRAMKHWGLRHLMAGFGNEFRKWLLRPDPQPYNSYGNGSAMRVSAIGALCPTLRDVLREAQASAMPSHDHPEGIKGAQATALAVFRARTGYSKARIAREITERFGYRLTSTVTKLRNSGSVNQYCQTSVPAALVCFLESNDYEETIRNAVWIGKDSDTIACIAGGIAAAYYQTIPVKIRRLIDSQLTTTMRSVLKHMQRTRSV